MRKYKALTQQTYKNGDFEIVPIRHADRFEIMQWRNEQMYHLRQNVLLTKTDQDKYFNNTIAQLFEEKQPEQLLFSYLKGDKLIGYGGLVHIDWVRGTAEISMIMETKLQKKHFIEIWTIFLVLIKHVALNANLTEVYTFAYDLRPKLYVALEQSGFKMFDRIPKAVRVGSEQVDIVIHNFSFHGQKFN